MTNNLKYFALIGAVLCALAVSAGAFGAHALKGTIDDYAMGVFEKAVLYHFIHALGLLAVIALSASGVIAARDAVIICLALFAGIIFFSGSLYILSVSGVRWWGAVTPVGGTSFIIAWALLARSLWRDLPKT